MANKGGTFKTNKICSIIFNMSLFHKHRDITWTAHVDESPRYHSKYDLIIGQDLLKELGTDLNFFNCSMHWNNAEVPIEEPMRLNEENINKFEKELFLPSEPETTDATRKQHILDTKYSKADLDVLVEKIGEINPEQKGENTKCIEEVRTSVQWIPRE